MEEKRFEIDFATQMFLARVATQTGMKAYVKDNLLSRETATGFASAGTAQSIILSSTDDSGDRTSIVLYPNAHAPGAAAGRYVLTLESKAIAEKKPFLINYVGSRGSNIEETLIPTDKVGRAENPELKYKVAQFLIETGNPVYVEFGQRYMKELSGEIPTPPAMTQAQASYVLTYV